MSGKQDEQHTKKTPAVVSDVDFYRTANILVKQHGKDAPTYRRQCLLFAQLLPLYPQLRTWEAPPANVSS